MAAVLLLAIAAKREIGTFRKRGQKIERTACGRFVHLLPEATGEDVPLLLGSTRLPLRHQLRFRRELRIPDIEPILLGVALLADAAGWSPHSAYAYAFALESRR